MPKRSPSPTIKAAAVPSCDGLNFVQMTLPPGKDNANGFVHINDA